MFGNIFARVILQCVYHVTEAVQAVVGSIVVVGALTCKLDGATGVRTCLLRYHSPAH